MRERSVWRLFGLRFVAGHPMPDTCDTAQEAAADRAQQLELLEALGAWDRALRREACGAWTVMGSAGTIHTYGDGRTWVIYLRCQSEKQWAWAKKKLAFCPVIVDGDEEGTFRLHGLPTDAQVTVIRELLRISQAR